MRCAAAIAPEDDCPRWPTHAQQTKLECVYDVRDMHTVTHGSTGLDREGLPVVLGGHVQVRIPFGGLEADGHTDGAFRIALRASMQFTGTRQRRQAERPHVPRRTENVSRMHNAVKNTCAAVQSESEAETHTLHSGTAHAFPGGRPPCLPGAFRRGYAGLSAPADRRFQGHTGALQASGPARSFGTPREEQRPVNGSQGERFLGAAGEGQLALHSFSSILGEGSGSNGHNGAAQDSKRTKTLRSPPPTQKYGSQRVQVPLFHDNYPNCAPQDWRSQGSRSGLRRGAEGRGRGGGVGTRPW